MVTHRVRGWALGLIGVVAVLLVLAWMAEVDVTDDAVIGTGLAAVAAAFAYWFFDLRRKRHRRR
jgi:hypothetical protein